jgi:hypothetical protein
MPIPTPRKDEDRSNFMSRCMSDPEMKKEYKDNSQRVAVCMSKACDGLTAMAAADFKYNFEELGYTEELNEDNFYIPSSAEYVDFSEDEEEWDVAIAKPGLWENIRKKKEREGKDYRPAKPGDKDRPDPESWKKAQNAEYQGRKVTLNKPFRTPDGPKKFAVYTKNKSGNVIIVRFGDPNMEIKKDIPERRKSFRARHKCDTAKDKTTPRYWSCKMW